MNECAGLKKAPYKCTTIFAVNGTCVDECMTNEYGFTANCSTAFGNMGVCGFNNCKAPCISGDPENAACVKCNE